VIGHDVEHLAQVVLAQRCAEMLVRDRAAEVGTDPPRIDDVVAMGAAR
jgi:hypothetical protein